MIDSINIVRRKLTENSDGTFTLEVTPSSTLAGASTVVLTAGQAVKYDEWRRSRKSIRDVFPELTSNQQEIILSGTSNDWERMFEDDRLGIIKAQITSRVRSRN